MITSGVKLYTGNYIQDCHGKNNIGQEESSFSTRLDWLVNLRKSLVKCHIWSTVLYGTEIGTVRKADQKYLESSGMWCWRRTEKIIWTDRMRNEEGLRRGGGEENPTN
jgi:hypothetical protein